MSARFYQNVFYNMPRNIKCGSIASFETFYTPSQWIMRIPTRRPLVSSSAIEIYSDYMLNSFFIVGKYNANAPMVQDAVYDATTEDTRKKSYIPFRLG